MASDFVTVHIDESDHVDDGPAVAAENDDAAESLRQRSLLEALWSEATSTTDLPSPASRRRLQLHHRRHAAGTNSNSSGVIAGRDPAATAAATTPSKRRAGSSCSNGRGYNQRNRVTRGAKIAKRVWLAAFAAFAASILISIHVFLYRVFMRSEADSGAVANSLTRGSVVKNGQQILGAEDERAKMTLEEARSHELASIRLHSVDTSQFTIRINTWRRDEQLLASLNHHSSCECVKEIQVVWCDAENEPPDEVAHHPSGKVRIEKHAINSLNERFKVLVDPPTLGILSLDDDVLRPCIALDAAFVRWTRHPERMVGFDARTHVVAEGADDASDNNQERPHKWKYGYMSTTESSNRYSMTLPRASFIHRDYLDLYTMALPRPIYRYIAENLECEDIAMSFLVSSLTDGKPPLLADYWAVKSMIKLYSPKRISGGKDHKSTRDACVNDFAERLGLKEGGRALTTEKLMRGVNSFFGYGAEPEDWANIDPRTFKSEWLQGVVEALQNLKSSSKDEYMSWLLRQKARTMADAKKAGLIEKTEEWKERWGESGQENI